MQQPRFRGEYYSIHNATTIIASRGFTQQKTKEYTQIEKQEIRTAPATL